MHRPLTLALMQTSPKIGDFNKNREQIIEQTTEAAGRGAELLIAPSAWVTIDEHEAIESAR